MAAVPKVYGIANEIYSGNFATSATPRLWIRGTSKMFKLAVAGFVLAMCVAFARAQDIAGIEDCTRAAGLDKRTSCLQSNINFLQRLLTKNALEAGQQLRAAATEI